MTFRGTDYDHRHFAFERCSGLSRDYFAKPGFWRRLLRFLGVA